MARLSSLCHGIRMAVRADPAGLAPTWERRALLFTILAAAALRLWRLDTPSLWLDEILVAMVAKLPFWTIVKRSLAEDFHPPTFYLLAKLTMSVGMGDAVLRLPQTAFGLAGVWFAWKSGREMLSTGGGLILAAFTTLQPWHILLSRQLRPYSIIFLFSMMSFFFLWRAIRDGKSRDFVLAGLCLWPPLLLHFSSMLAAGGAGLSVLVAWVRGRVKLHGIVLFCLTCGLGVVMVLPFLASLLHRESGITAGATYPEVVSVILDNLKGLIFREFQPRLRVGLACLAALGLADLFLRKRLLAWVTLGWFLFPLLALVAMRFGSYFNPWHLTFLLPPMLLCQAQAVRMLCGERLLPWLAVGCVVFGSWWYFNQAASDYYAPEISSGDYREQAAQLLGSRQASTIYVYPPTGVTGTLNWYLDQFASPNPLRTQRLDPAESSIRVVVPGSQEPARVLPRTPVILMGSLPFKTWITCDPEEFLARVNRMEGVACQPVLEKILVATQAGRTGFAEFRFTNTSPQPQKITIDFGFSNRQPGNRFAARCRFDDEPWASSFESIGPDARGYDKIELKRAEPFRCVTVRFELWRNDLSATFSGEDTDAVSFLDFKLAATPLEK